MKTYCIKCRRGTENTDPKMVGTNNRLVSYASKMPCLRN